MPHPPRFSPEDRYVVYRYRMKLAAGLIASEGGVEERKEKD